MPHLVLLVTYTAISIVVNWFDIIVSHRIITETQDNMFFWVAMVVDWSILVYLIFGLYFAVFAFWGMEAEKKERAISTFFIFLYLLGAGTIATIIGLNSIIWRNPGEFIDLTWLFALVVLGFNVLKWVVILSFTISLAEIARSLPNMPTPPAYQLVNTNMPMEQPVMMPFAKEEPKTWVMPQAIPVYMP